MYITVTLCILNDCTTVAFDNKSTYKEISLCLDVLTPLSLAV